MSKFTDYYPKSHLPDKTPIINLIDATPVTLIIYTRNHGIVNKPRGKLGLINTDVLDYEILDQGQTIVWKNLDKKMSARDLICL